MKSAKERISNILLNQHAELKSWAKVAAIYDLNKALVWKVAKTNYEPKDPEIRAKLGLPQVIQQVVHRDEHGRFRKSGNG